MPEYDALGWGAVCLTVEPICPAWRVSFVTTTPLTGALYILTWRPRCGRHWVRLFYKIFLKTVYFVLKFTERVIFVDSAGTCLFWNYLACRDYWSSTGASKEEEEPPLIKGRGQRGSYHPGFRWSIFESASAFIQRILGWSFFFLYH
jgi:hypothetical protein